MLLENILSTPAEERYSKAESYVDADYNLDLPPFFFCFLSYIDTILLISSIFS